jgi:hypothetical protein
MQAQWFCAAGVLAIKEQQQQNLPRGELQRGVGFVGKWFKRYVLMSSISCEKHPIPPE